MGSLAVSQDSVPHASIKATKQQAVQPVGKHVLDIIDIRRVAVETNLKDDIISMWNPTNGPRRLPTLLLYNERGLQLFEDITYLEEYYLTNNEIEVLEKNSKEIAQNISTDSMVIELGNAGKNIDYYALDLSREELERTLAQVPDFHHVKCHGLLGTYDDGREWLKQPSNLARTKCILSLGSSIGNFERDDAAGFLKHFSDVLTQSDKLLIGLDGCCDPSKVYHGYNGFQDQKGVTHAFILNGLANANEILGEEAFKLKDWEVIGEYVYDDEGGRHQAFYSPVRDTYVLGALVRQHERIQVEQSLKYSQLGAENLWNMAGLVETNCWTKGTEHGIHMISKRKMPFSRLPELYASSPCPTLDDWEALWAAWDAVTQQMLPKEELLDQPIKLRNACIFYLGHIPGFLDIQLCKTTKTPPTEPAHFQPMFERGIDPDVDNPEQCHSHSEIPDEWPAVEEILQYQQRVRSRLLDQYKNGIDNIPRAAAQGIWVGFEHEIMHMETLLYMMLQSDKTIPPPDVLRPDFKRLANKARQSRVSNQWHDVPAQSIILGMDEPDLDAGVNGYFGWHKDDRSQMRSVVPDSFLDGIAVRTVYGLVPLKYALDWPIFASFDELAGCAAWMGGRIPTFEEARSIYTYVHNSKKMEAERTLGRTVPAVNGHLSNDGVEETPPKRKSLEAAKARSELFADLDGANVGLQHWHPVPVTADGGRLAGQGELGGVWEWTSTPLARHEGFEPMPLYPQYTADFFDGKHNIVLGGSWSTHPRIAGRRSFVNWYQRNYPFAWCGARLVRDIK
ncbi:hypothetical protein COL5a_001387 [Colletotrichum fioriniae]|nr:hypothetical protein COL5a_001387 [Colletotrichum fioriniae]